MKILPCLLLLSLLCPVVADEPAELVKLRTTYEKSLRSEFQKVGKLYHGRLVELKKNYMEAQDLEAAVAVDTEIKKLRETHGKMVVEVPEAEETSSPLDGAWICSFISKGKIRRILYCIKGDKMMSEIGAEVTVKNHNGVITAEWENGWWHKITPSPDDPDVMTGTNKGNTQLTYTRVKW